MRSLGALLLLATLALAAPRVGRADSLTETFTRGNDAFAQGRYEGAIEAYETLLDAGVSDPDVAYNLATAYARLGQYGQAIRFYERALRLAPRDDQARAGLRNARRALGQRQASDKGEAIVATRPPLTAALFEKVTAGELAGVLLAAMWLLTACLAALRRVHGETTRLTVGIAGSVCALLVVVAGLGLGIKTHWGAEGEPAIVLREGAPLREGPDDRATERERLPEGARVRALSRERQYFRVETPSGVVAYMHADDVGPI